ncbi:hypothetical protein BD780_000330 [Clostridium tetanomorphum]|uniref:Amidase domain-containing protein n=1 Tax=Clostridium tetanomorphum TaxID=1553 RepID=A0A923EAF9_CLOTT|nr:hypothetical protein [Clostridium tetanomorphum]KAJ48869.1 hypothetical protein CTM_26013 [Clostridium tetanomorphum DSM 665]KAJ52959.1 hypothetical protein CTM_04878 [Clostridium tetanomorphum DSM 665]MBC2398212.1 hypothetical protein [Clostridium tetanomorphum]MBP1864899.1 hypothetical protein [Clostridium tetanomorphum]NRS83105.1 hypothetical protein [Clostridium tetanomorphum]
MKKVKPLAKIILLGLLFVSILKNVIPDIKNNIISKNYSSENVHEFLMSKKNRQKTYLAAVDLNGGNSENTCVFFVSEVLRRNNYEVPKYMGNTGDFINFLNERGWKKQRNYKKLKPGDICFTTDEKGTTNGIPSHTYIFMGWVEGQKYDYAYICDNQAKDYDNQVYHIRNIRKVDTIKGLTKDAFSFFMTSQ